MIKYPKQIHVQWQGAPKEEYLSAHTDTETDELDNGSVAVYELVKIGTKTTDVIIKF